MMMDEDDRFLSELGCTVRLSPPSEFFRKPEEGVLLLLEMRQPNDQRTAEVYLNKKNVDELVALLQRWQRSEYGRA